MRHDSVSGDLVRYDLSTGTDATVATIARGTLADDRGITWAVDRFGGDIAYVDAANAVHVVDPGVIRTAPAAGIVSDYSAGRIDFGPYGTWQVNYGLSRPVAAWTLTITQVSTGKVVGTRTGGPNRVVLRTDWNGYLTNKKKASSGHYKYTTTVTATAGATPVTIDSGALLVDGGTPNLHSYESNGQPSILGVKSDARGHWLIATAGTALRDNGPTDEWSWGSKSSQVNAIVPFGDVNNDGMNDVIARSGTGTLRAYLGIGQSYFGEAKKVTIGSGWNRYNAILTSGDLTGDGIADLLARDKKGKIWRYNGTGKKPFAPRVALAGSYKWLYCAVLVLGRVSQDRLTEVATECGAHGVTGATSASGWTALRSDDAVLVPGRLADSDRVVVDDAPGGPRLLLLPSRSTMLAAEGLELSWGSGSMRPGPVAEIAARLAGWFRIRSGVVDLAHSLQTARIADGIDVLLWLNESLELPHIYASMPVAMAVGSPGDPDDRRIGETMQGEALLGYTPEGWRVLRARYRLAPSIPDPQESTRLAIDLSKESPGDSLALLLYRDDDGTGAGVQIWRSGDLAGERFWHPSARSVPPQEAWADGIDDPFRSLLGAPVDEERLSVLKPESVPHLDSLVEFVELFGLPDRLLQALDDPDAFGRRDDVTLIGRASRWQLGLEAARANLEAQVGGPAETPLQRVLAVGAALAASLGVLGLVAVVAVLVESAVSTRSVGDGLGALGLAALTLAVLPVVRLHFRRAFPSSS